MGRTGLSIRRKWNDRVATKATWALVALQLVITLASPVGAQGGIARLIPARPTGYVTDAAQALDPASVEAMTRTIERLRAATGAEIAVVTLQTIGDYAAVDVAVAIGRAWGVGAKAEIGDQRRNAGLVILLVPKRADDPSSGQIFIAPGQGLEGVVTDAMAGRVRDLMRPQLGAGEYGPGLLTGVNALGAIIARGFGVSDSTLLAGGKQTIQRTRPPPMGMIILFVIFALVILFIVLPAAARQARYGGPRGPRGPNIFMGGPGWGGGFGGSGGGWGGGFGGFGGGGGFSGGGAGGRF